MTSSDRSPSTSLNDLVWTLPFAQTNFCKHVPTKLVPVDFRLRDRSLALARICNCSCKNITGIKRNSEIRPLHTLGLSESRPVRSHHVSCCPQALLANQDIFKNASPAAEQRLPLTQAWPQPLLQRAFLLSFLPSLLSSHSPVGRDSEQPGRLGAPAVPSPAAHAEKAQSRCT